jgi:carboxylesterase
MWNATTAGLRQVRQPLLVYRSTVDHVVGPPSMRVLRDALPDVEVRELRNSYHVATLDNDAPEIFSGSLGFIRKYVTDSVSDSGV